MGLNIIDLLLPRETRFFDLLSELSDQLTAGCGTFRDLIVQIDGLSEEDIQNRILIIKEYEQKSDRAKAEIIDALWRSFITPIDRDDIHTLAINMERAMDMLNGTSRKIEMFHLRQMPENARQFANIIADIARLQGELIHGLPTKKKDVREKVTAMHDLEHRADDLFHHSLAALFNDEEKYHTVENMKFKELYEHLEIMVDRIDHIGKIIHGIRMKQG